MEYVSAREISKVWGISQRRVSTLCSEGRVEGAQFVGNMWIIPNDAKKPNDLRNNITSEKDKLLPFVKWAGGKRQILDKLKSRMPKTFGRYYEPFVGGGALFFDLAYPSVTINDINPELVSVYKSLKDPDLFELLIQKLEFYENTHNSCNSLEEAQELFYKVRMMDQYDDYESLPIYEKAARMIYLNKTCFNGLYRVNSKGFFNVPFANKLPVSLYSLENLSSINSYMMKNDVVIKNTFFDKAVEDAIEGDFVYFDPPYDKLRNEKENKSFTSYAKDGFEEQEQMLLAQVFKDLSDKGVYCMLSNHNTPLINELYKDFNIDIIHAKRQINSKASGRGPVEEVVITNYSLDRSDYND